MLLFLALMIVYIVRYQVKGVELKNKIQKENEWSDVQIMAISGSEQSQSGIWEDDWTSLTGLQEPVALATGKMTIQTSSTWTTSLSSDVIKKNNTIKVLSGTSIYYWPIGIIEQLGIKYQYALTDSSWIRYIYLGTPSYDFASIARALKGNIYVMATEQEIIANKLFWNKVVFINLPEYKDKQVIMLVYMNDGIWLIQVEYSMYHKMKAHIKSLFID